MTEKTISARQGRPVAVPGTLSLPLVSMLAAVLDQPPGVAELVLSAARYGSRVSLVEHGLIEPVPTAGDAGVEIVITPRGWDVISACAERVSQQPEWLEADDRKADALLARLRQGTGDFGRVRGDGRPRPEQPDPYEIAGALPPALVEVLANVHDQPAGIAELCLAAMDYQLREPAIQAGIIRPVPTVGPIDPMSPDDSRVFDGAIDVVITSLGWSIIEVAATALSADPAERERRDVDAKERLERLRRVASSVIASS